MYCIWIFFVLFLSGCSSLKMSSLGDLVAIPPFEPKEPVNVALVLGGGGAKGLAHLGAIRELELAGIRPDLIVGCSAGAIAGALYADQPYLEDRVEMLLPLRKADILDYAINPIFGIVHGDLLQNLMKNLLRAKTFEELQIPLIVVVTDLISGEAIELSKGDLSSAIRASCSVPGIFKPFSLYGRYCIDGGAACPIPVSIAKKYGAKVVIAIDLSEQLPKKHPRHLLGVTKRSLEIGYRKFIEQSLSQADVAIRMNFDEVGLFNDSLNEWLYEQGRAAIRDKLDEIRSKIEKIQCILPSIKK